MKWILTFPGVLMFSTWCHRWSHRAHTVPPNIAYPQYLSFTGHDICRIYLPWRHPLTGVFPLPHSLRTRQQSLLAHHWARTSAFHNLPWCNPPQAAVSIGTALGPYDLCCANKEWHSYSSPLPPAMRLVTSALHSYPWCNPLIPLSSLSEPGVISFGTALNPQESVTTKIAPPHDSSSTSHETGYFCLP